MKVDREVQVPQTAPGVLRWRSRFELPAGSSDGGKWWYLVRLGFRFTHSDLKKGELEVSASVNGLAAIGVEMHLRNSRRCGGPEIAWSTIDLIRGARTRWKCGSSASVVSLNFTQLRAIRPGSATFDVSAQGDIDDADRLVVLPGSGIYKSHDGPAKLAFAPLSPVDGVAVGSWTKLPFRLVNRGDRPAREISVSAAPESGLVVRPRRIQVASSIPPHGEAKGSVWIQARHAGAYKLVLSARSTANSPGVEVSLETSRGGSGGATKDLALASAVVCAAGLVLLRRWRTLAR